MKRAKSAPMCPRYSTRASQGRERNAGAARLIGEREEKERLIKSTLKESTTKTASIEFKHTLAGEVAFAALNESFRKCPTLIPTAREVFRLRCAKEGLIAGPLT